jgi:hypothetical protein
MTEALKQALQMALEDLTEATSFTSKKSRDRQAKTLAALRTALTQADHFPDAGKMIQATASEPVARIDGPLSLGRDGLYRAEVTFTRGIPQFTDLYTAQPAPAARKISRDDLKVLMSESGYVHVTAQEKADFINGFRHAEAHHGIGSQPTAPAVPADVSEAKWCEYIAAALDCWLLICGADLFTMGRDRRVKAMEGIIIRRMWTLKREATPAAAPAVPEVSNDHIRAVFMSNGFTIKEGCTDLKPYVYAAARALLASTPTSTKGGV